MVSTKKRIWKYILSILLILGGNLLIFLAIWMSKKYDQVSLDQFIYQTKASAAGANRSLMNSAYIRVGLFGFLLTAGEVLLYLLFNGTLIRLIKQAYPHVKKAFFVCVRYGTIVGKAVCKFAVRHFLPISACIAVIAIGYFTIKMNFASYLYGMFTNSDFIKENYVDPADVELSFPEKKRNLIYIFLESLETTFSDPEAGGYIYDNFMPELTDLAEKNICFSHDADVGGAKSYYGTTWTAAAMVTQTSGTIVQVPVTAKNFGNNGNPYMPGLVTIGEVLEKEGYSNTLLFGSDARFANRDVYFTEHGNYTILDTESLKAAGRLDPDYRVWWGFEDQKLFEYAKEELTRLAAEDQPFNLTMLTADTHFPNGYVCELCQNEYKKQYPDVVRCSSRQLSAFIEWIQAQPFYENTTIVLCGDHLTMDPKFMRPVNPEYQRSIYNCIINPAVTPENEKFRDYGTFDMYPTTLAALGVEIPGNRLGLGTNLFSSEKTLAEKFGYEYVNEQFEKKSDFFNEKILGMN